MHDTQKVFLTFGFSNRFEISAKNSVKSFFFCTRAYQQILTRYEDSVFILIFFITFRIIILWN